MIGLLLVGALLLGTGAQDSPFGRKKGGTSKEEKPGGKKKGRKETPPPPRAEEPVEIEKEAEDKALEQLGSDDPAVRQAAFGKLYQAHKDSRARSRLRGLFGDWTRTFKAARKEAIAGQGQERGEIGSLREKALEHFKEKNTKAMRPLVEQMFARTYHDWRKADQDPGVQAAAERLKELDQWLRWVGERKKRDMREVLEEIAFDVDEVEFLNRMPSGKSTASANRGARRGLSMKEYKLVLITNMYRAMMNKKTLRINPALCSACKGHSRDMKKRGFFAHESPVPGKKTPYDRARRAGTSCGAENICGAGDAWTAFWRWFMSIGHHENMMSDSKQIGIGEFEGLWTECF